MVVTLDADFHEYIAKVQALSPSVVRIRIEGLKGEALANLLVQVVSTLSAELTAGAAVSVTDRHMRVRLYPLR